MSRIPPELTSGVRDTCSEQEMRRVVPMKYDYKHTAFKILVVLIMPHADSQFQHMAFK